MPRTPARKPARRIKDLDAAAISVEPSLSANLGSERSGCPRLREAVVRSGSTENLEAAVAGWNAWFDLRKTSITKKLCDSFRRVRTLFCQASSNMKVSKSI